MFWEKNKKISKLNEDEIMFNNLWNEYQDYINKTESELRFLKYQYERVILEHKISPDATDMAKHLINTCSTFQGCYMVPELTLKAIASGLSN